VVFLRSVRRLLVAACAVPSSPTFVTLMKDSPGSSETSVLTRATRRNNPEDTILREKYDFTNDHVCFSVPFDDLFSRDCSSMKVEVELQWGVTYAMVTGREQRSNGQ
jgi:hypothetical protein